MQFKLSHKLTPRWGTAIKHYRQSKGLSVSEFSTFLGVSKQAVYYWEKNQREAPSTLTWAIYKELKDNHKHTHSQYSKKLQEFTPPTPPKVFKPDHLLDIPIE